MCRGFQEVFFSLSFAISVSSCQLSQPAKPHQASDTAPAWEQLGHAAFNAAQKDSVEGFRQLFVLATQEDGEPALYGIEALHTLLYTNTESWVRSLAKEDTSTLRRFVSSSGVADAGWEGEDDITPRFREVTQSKLSRLNCTGRETFLQGILLARLTRP